MKSLFLPLIFFYFLADCFCQGSSPSNSTDSNPPAFTILRSNVGLSGSSSTFVTSKGPHTINQSIGQASVIGTTSISIVTFLQGYQQPTSPIEAPIIENLKENVLRVIIGPNPANAWVDIIFEETITEEIEIRLIDFSGSVARTEKYAPSQIQRVPLEGLATGIYLLQVFSKDKQVISKILKQ